MKFKVDENLPVEVANLLGRAGHDAKTVIEQHLGGHDDFYIAAFCQQEERILVTLDTDFADIRVYPPEQYSGLIVLRLKKQDKYHIIEIVSRLIGIFSSETPDRHLWIVEEKRVRISN